jgi:hypothetical protein
MEMMEGIFMFLIFACGAFAGFIGGAATGRWFEGPKGIYDWEEEAYRPRPHREEPRAITRLTSTEIDWEIK